MPRDSWNHLLAWWSAHWTWFFWILMLLVAVRLAIRWFRISAAESKDAKGSTEQILRLRHARGEIDKSEYERKLSRLRRLRKSA